MPPKRKTPANRGRSARSNGPPAKKVKVESLSSAPMKKAVVGSTSKAAVRSSSKAAVSSRKRGSSVGPKPESKYDSYPESPEYVINVQKENSSSKEKGEHTANKGDVNSKKDDTDATSQKDSSKEGSKSRNDSVGRRSSIGGTGTIQFSSIGGRRASRRFSTESMASMLMVTPRSNEVSARNDEVSAEDGVGEERIRIDKSMELIKAAVKENSAGINGSNQVTTFLLIIIETSLSILKEHRHPIQRRSVQMIKDTLKKILANKISKTRFAEAKTREDQMESVEYTQLLANLENDIDVVKTKLDNCWDRRMRAEKSIETIEETKKIFESEWTTALRKIEVEQSLLLDVQQKYDSLLKPILERSYEFKGRSSSGQPHDIKGRLSSGRRVSTGSFIGNGSMRLSIASNMENGIPKVAEVEAPNAENGVAFNNAEDPTPKANGRTLNGVLVVDPITPKEKQENPSGGVTKKIILRPGEGFYGQDHPMFEQWRKKTERVSIGFSSTSRLSVTSMACFNPVTTLTEIGILLDQMSVDSSLKSALMSTFGRENMKTEFDLIALENLKQHYTQFIKTTGEGIEHRKNEEEKAKDRVEEVTLELHEQREELVTIEEEINGLQGKIKELQDEIKNKSKNYDSIMKKAEENKEFLKERKAEEENIKSVIEDFKWLKNRTELILEGGISSRGQGCDDISSRGQGCDDISSEESSDDNESVDGSPDRTSIDGYGEEEDKNQLPIPKLNLPTTSNGSILPSGLSTSSYGVSVPTIVSSSGICSRRNSLSSKASQKESPTDKKESSDSRGLGLFGIFGKNSTIQDAKEVVESKKQEVASIPPLSIPPLVHDPIQSPLVQDPKLQKYMNLNLNINTDGIEELSASLIESDDENCSDGDRENCNDGDEKNVCIVQNDKPRFNKRPSDAMNNVEEEENNDAMNNVEEEENNDAMMDEDDDEEYSGSDDVDDGSKDVDVMNNEKGGLGLSSDDDREESNGHYDGILHAISVGHSDAENSVGHSDATISVREEEEKEKLRPLQEGGSSVGNIIKNLFSSFRGGDAEVLN